MKDETRQESVHPSSFILHPSKWGKLAKGWDAAHFKAALEAAPGSDERSRLVGDLVQDIFPVFRGIAQGKDEAYVDLDVGLSIISAHAKSLGYDGLILFLDELILWLATHSADLGFVQTEGNKLAKLVESRKADRPVPIVSFVAWQRDLRELIGENVTGVEQLNFSDVLSHWEGRFHTITLEDRNLPVIAQKRVLKPKSEVCHYCFVLTKGRPITVNLLRDKPNKCAGMMIRRYRPRAAGQGQAPVVGGLRNQEGWDRSRGPSPHLPVVSAPTNFVPEKLTP